MQPGEEKAQEDLTDVCKHLKGWCKDNRARLCSVVPSDGIRSNGHTLKQTEHKKTPFYCEGDRALA